LLNRKIEKGEIIFWKLFLNGNGVIKHISNISYFYLRKGFENSLTTEIIVFEVKVGKK
jgi:hypothetical protein